jgi:cell wall-associated NlpC family hydrolase
MRAAIVLAVFFVVVAVATTRAASAAPPVDEAALQTGDLVFQTSESAQSGAIREAQRGHPATHVGIVVRDGARVQILEAVGPVQLTPLAAFRRRGGGGAVAVYRDPRLDDATRAAVVAAARQDLGRPYDPFFTDDDARIYCSELVWRAWRAVGLEIGRVQSGRELALEGPKVKRLLGERWRAHPGCRDKASIEACADVVAAQAIVTPASLMLDPRLVHVAGALPGASSDEVNPR